MKMKRGQEQACLDNIQGYLDRIEWLGGGGYPSKGPGKSCNLCGWFEIAVAYEKKCELCPLGPTRNGCGHLDSSNGFLSSFFWKEYTTTQLKNRMRWLLKKYKQAGLEIEIVEVATGRNN